MTTKKALQIISSDIIKKYHIQNLEGDNDLSIHNPCYINLSEDLEVEINETVTRISNNKVIVTLWNEVFNMHVTVL